MDFMTGQNQSDGTLDGVDKQKSTNVASLIKEEESFF